MRHLVPLVLLGGCSSPLVAAQRATLTHLADAVIRPDQDELVAATQQLEDDVRALCEAPSPARLTQAREAWWVARAPWKRSEVLAFGPVRDEPWRVGPKLDTWPARHDAIDTWLAGDSGLTPTDFAGMGSVTRGFPVLEVLLWHDDTVAWLPADPRRCLAAQGLAADIHALALTLHRAWSPDGDDWRARFVDPASSPGPFATEQDVIDELVNRLGFTIENIRHDKLGGPAGLLDGSDAQPELLESRPSGRSLRDAQDALAGVEALFRGDQAQGIEALLDTAPEDVAAFHAAHAAAAQALEDLPDPLEPALTPSRAAIGLARDALRDLQVVVQVDIAQSLSVTITFNDNDGD